MMRVSSTYLLMVDRNRYIIPAGFAGKAVFIRITADQVRMVADGEIIAARLGSFGRSNWSATLGIINLY